MKALEIMLVARLILAMAVIAVESDVPDNVKSASINSNTSVSPRARPRTSVNPSLDICEKVNPAFNKTACDLVNLQVNLRCYLCVACSTEMIWDWTHCYTEEELYNGQVRTGNSMKCAKSTSSGPDGVRVHRHCIDPCIWSSSCNVVDGCFISGPLTTCICSKDLCNRSTRLHLTSQVPIGLGIVLIASSYPL